MSKVVAGIDVSKSSLDVHAAGEERCFANDRTSWRALDKMASELPREPVGDGGHGPLSPQGSPGPS